MKDSQSFNDSEEIVLELDYGKGRSVTDYDGARKLITQWCLALELSGSTLHLETGFVSSCFTRMKS